MSDLLFAGQELSFIVPDSFRHENTERNFVLVTEDDVSYSLMYFNNECSCKDGWIKFPKIVKYPVTIEKIKEELSLYYREKFDAGSLKIKTI